LRYLKLSIHLCHNHYRILRIVACIFTHDRFLLGLGAIQVYQKRGRGRTSGRPSAEISSTAGLHLQQFHATSGPTPNLTKPNLSPGHGWTRWLTRDAPKNDDRPDGTVTPPGATSHETPLPPRGGGGIPSTFRNFCRFRPSGQSPGKRRIFPPPPRPGARLCGAVMTARAARVRLSDIYRTTGSIGSFNYHHPQPVDLIQVPVRGWHGRDSTNLLDYTIITIWIFFF